MIPGLKGLQPHELAHSGLKDILTRPDMMDKSRSRELGGVGLGLAFVREIVRVHDGSICIKSGKTGGTIFEVTFAQHSM